MSKGGGRPSVKSGVRLIFAPFTFRLRLIHTRLRLIFQSTVPLSPLAPLEPLEPLESVAGQAFAAGVKRSTTLGAKAHTEDTSRPGGDPFAGADFSYAAV